MLQGYTSIFRYVEPEVTSEDLGTQPSTENPTNNIEIIELDSPDEVTALEVPTTDIHNITPKPMFTISQFFKNSDVYSLIERIASFDLLNFETIALKCYKSFVDGGPIMSTMAEHFSLQNYDLEKTKMLSEEEILADLKQFLEITGESVPSKKPRLEESVTQSSTSSMSNVTVINTQTLR
jgi:hypothetical protein